MSFGRRAIYAVSVLSLVLGIALWLLLNAPPLQSDLSQFLPSGKNRQQQLLLDELTVGAGSRMLIGAISGGSVEQRSAASRQFAAALTQSEHLERLLNGTQQLPQSERELLFRYRYLLQEQEFSPSALRQALQSRLAELASPFSLLDKQLLPADPTAALRTLLQAWGRGTKGPQKIDGVWFSEDSRQALLLLQTRADSFALDQQALAIDEMRQTFRQLPEAAGLKLTLSGGPLFAVEARENIRGEIRYLSLFSSLGVIALLWWVFHSLRVLLVAILPLLSAVLTAAATVVTLFGEMHGITLAFGVTLIGITVDYPIHYFSHLRFSSRRATSLSQLWRTLMLGVITTVLGFSSLLLSGFGGMMQLGVFAVSGLLVAAAVTRFVVPQLVVVQTADEERAEGIRTAFQHLAKWPLLRLVPLLLMTVALAYLLSLDGQVWESRLAKLSPISEQAKQQYETLRDALAVEDAGRMLIISATDLQQLLERSEELEPLLREAQQRGALSAYESPSTFLPSIRLQQQRQSALPPGDELSARLQQALKGLVFRDGLFAPFLDDVAQSREIAALQLEMLQGTMLGLRVETLLRQRGGEVLGIVKLTGVSDEVWLEQQLASRFVWLDYMNLHQASSQIVADYLQETLLFFVIAALLICSLLWLIMRSPRQVWRVMTPVLAAVLFSAAVQLLLGDRLTLFHVAALLLVMGFGLDYSIFMVRTPLSSAAFPITVRSLLICNLSTLLVFGLLASSEVPVLHFIGMTVSVGSLAALLFSFMQVNTDAEVESFR